MTGRWIVVLVAALVGACGSVDKADDVDGDSDAGADAALGAFDAAMPPADAAVRAVDASPEAEDAYVWLEGEGGTLIGEGYFNSDPSGFLPDNAIRSCDRSGDGWPIETQLDVDPGSMFVADWMVTTSGHNAPFCTEWTSLEIPEGEDVALRLCMYMNTDPPQQICGPPDFGRS